MNILPTIDPAGGLSFRNEDTIMEVPASTAVAVGDVLAVNLTVVNSSNILARLKAVAVTDFQPVAESETTTFFCVALDAVASSTAVQKIRVRFRGTVSVNMNGATPVVVGDKLKPVDGQAYLATAASGLAGTTTVSKTVGIALEALASGTALKRVLFNGIEGFGVGYSVS